MPYTPSKLPKLTDPDAIALAQYFEDELQSLSRGLVENITELDLSPIFAAPKKPREGMIVYADGTLWNPGSGEGLYVYSSGALWVWLETATKTLSVKTQIFISSGTYTPTVGMVSCVLECWAGGGAGGGCASAAAGVGTGGGGGGAGGYSLKVSTAVDIGASQTVTIGIAGVIGTAGNNPGGNGGDTSIGALCIAKGGTGGGGTAATTSPGGASGAGGVAGTGDVTGTGQSGLPGYLNAASSGIGIGGAGGSTSLGSGGRTIGAVTSQAGSSGTGFGTGGSGGQSFNAGGAVAGGPGKPGFVKIVEFIYA